MRRALKPIVCLLLTALVMLSLASCNRRYDEDEVIASAEALLRKAEVLNEIYYGHGIQYITSGYVDGYYYEADPIHLNSLGFETIEELKNKTLEVFTYGYAEEIFETKLSMIEDETGVQEMTRYYQRYDGPNLLAPICIMVYSKAPVTFVDEVIYDYTSLRVTGSKKQTVLVKVDATVTNSEGKSQTVTVNLNLIEEDDGWRIDNPCYANYNDSMDKYNELDK